MSKGQSTVKYPGQRAAMDGNTAVIMCERESTDAAGAYPITPSTQMGEYWAEATAQGHINVSGRRSGGHGRALHDRPAGLKLFFRAGHRLHA